MATFIVILAFVGLLAVAMLLWAVFLRWGLRWAKVRPVTTGRLAIAASVVLVLQHAIAFGSKAYRPVDLAQSWAVEVVQLVAILAMQWLVIAAIFRASIPRAVQAWLPTLMSQAIVAVFAAFVFIPHVVEAFVSPSNAMAPTLLGNHWVGACGTCGGPAYCSPDEFHRDGEPSLMICRDHYHVARSAGHGEKVFAADAFLVAKFLAPRRWDVIAFRTPEDPSVFYCMRLVGLPGEEIVLREGRVWANGRELSPPPDIAGIEYLSELADWDGALWGTPDRPAKLGADEYFVLGDFSARSNDSRLWEQGSPGRPPYAVPESHLHGVVTHVYWPPARWRAFR